MGAHACTTVFGMSVALEPRWGYSPLVLKPLTECIDGIRL